uniref:RNA helicase n=1 Tax=Hydatigena taeniaeformis TaxID=6205 RepID=A0A0R3X5A4_HYDTA
LDRKLLHNISLLHLTNMTPVQMHAIPLLLTDPSAGASSRNVGLYDLMAAAQTGSGKTLAYLLPILQRIMRTYPADSMTALADNNYQVQFPLALILAPTRELAHQIRLEASKLCYRTHVRPVALYGGEKPGQQISEIRRGSHLIVATPGRLLDFLGERLLNLSFCRNLVIDEADRLLDMGFEPQLRKIIQSRTYGLPDGEDRQTALFSATFPPNVALLARDFLRGSRCISLNVVRGDDVGAGELPVPVWGQAVIRNRHSSEDAFKQLKATVPKEIIQKVEWVKEINHGRGVFPTNMFDRLVTVLTSEAAGRYFSSVCLLGLCSSTFFLVPDISCAESVKGDLQCRSVDCKQRVLVFCNTKREVDLIDRCLVRQGFNSVSIHGDRSQARRNHSVNCFRDGKANILVASSVVARGMDFPKVEVVINFGLPLGLDEYVHRIGRTGRMGQAGRAITLVPSHSIGSDKHLQGIARGICRLVSDPSCLPNEFIRAARWNPEDVTSVDELTSSHRSKVPLPRSQQRLVNQSSKRKKPFV